MTFRFGRILYLTEDPELLRRQLGGEDLPREVTRNAKLIDSISTDEITPGWACFYYDEALADYALVGLRGGIIGAGALRRGGFTVLVSGESKGCGSSREHAPYAEYCAGIRLVIAKSIEKIYRQNCQNIGLLTSTDFRLLDRGEFELEELTADLDSISAPIVASGGLFAYNQGRMSGAIQTPQVTTPPRRMTMVEKIIASHALVDTRSGRLGVPAVAPGDALFIRADVRFSHEYVTPMAESLFVSAMGSDAKVAAPESVWLFRDHLTFVGQTMSEDKKRLGLLDRADSLARVQAAFAERHGIALYGETESGGSHAICHNAVVEDIGWPGQVIIGTDSHTCMAGALSAFAFGVGSTDMANAWYTRDVRVRVPETVRVRLSGALRAGVCAKDIMLYLLSRPFFRTSRGIGKVLEFCGDGLDSLCFDEQATLANMAVEAGGFTGIVEPNRAIIDYLVQQRGAREDDVHARLVYSDEGASYLETIDLQLDAIPVMIATPGDPRNGTPLDQLGEAIPIDIAYGGSCTGGKKRDMDMYAEVLSRAVRAGARVAAGVRLYLQYGSSEIQRYCQERGYVEIFEAAGATMIAPSCGACINAGPGSSTSPEQVTVSAINRNFPGRSGPGKVYLASPLTVVESALSGHLGGAARDSS